MFIDPNKKMIKVVWECQNFSCLQVRYFLYKWVGVGRLIGTQDVKIDFNRKSLIKNFLKVSVIFEFWFYILNIPLMLWDFFWGFLFRVCIFLFHKLIWGMLTWPIQDDQKIHTNINLWTWPKILFTHLVTWLLV